MKTVLLKNVPEEDWINFKTEAASHNMQMAQFLVYVLREHTERKHINSKDKWKRILSWRSGRSKNELEAIEKKMNKFRKNFKLER